MTHHEKDHLHLRSINLYNVPIIVEDDEEDDAAYRRRCSTRSTIQRNMPQMTSGMDEDEETEKHIQDAATTTAEIPIPNVRKVQDYEATYNHQKGFERPETYIKYKDTMSEGLGHLVEYDLDDEDEAFLRRTNKKGQVLTEEKLEFIIYLLERESFENQQKIPSLDEVEHLFDKLPEEVLTKVYNYWREKRADGPLIARFCSINAFHAHKDDFKRRFRKDNFAAYQKMLALRLQLEQARLLLETVIKREKTKREQTTVLGEITELQLYQFAAETATKKRSKSPKQAKKQKRQKITKTAKKDNEDMDDIPIKPSKLSDDVVSESDAPNKKRKLSVKGSPPPPKMKAKSAILHAIHTKNRS
jgi:hypothetical protein